jgi:hypothetical protein
MNRAASRGSRRRANHPKSCFDPTAKKCSSSLQGSCAFKQITAPAPKKHHSILHCKYTLAISLYGRKQSDYKVSTPIHCGGGDGVPRFSIVRCVCWDHLFCHSVPTSDSAASLGWVGAAAHMMVKMICLHYCTNGYMFDSSHTLRRKMALWYDCRDGGGYLVVRILSWERIWDVVPPYRTYRATLSLSRSAHCFGESHGWIVA